MTKKEFLQKYEIDVAHGRLGGGGFGTVYKAYDTINSTFKAVKVSEVKYLGKKKFSLIDEFNATRDLDAHRNIANYEAVYQFEMSNGVFDYAVMQYYPFGNLKELIRTQNLNTVQKIEIAKGLINGVHYLHQNHIIHRDLKPSNILIAERNNVYTPKIADFGLSKIYDSGIEDISNSVGGGTLEYSSPEQLKGLPLKPNTDIWSLGVIIYELFIGRIPFETTTSVGNEIHRRHKILENIGSDKPIEGIEQCPHPFNEVVQQSLVKDQSLRLQSSQDLIVLLNQPSESTSGSMAKPQQFIAPGSTEILSKKELEKLIEAERKQQEIKKKHKELIAIADAQFKINNWTAAISAYDQASLLMPDDQYGPNQVAKCKQLQFEEQRRGKEAKEKAAYGAIVSRTKDAYNQEQWYEVVNLLKSAAAIMPLDKTAHDIKALAESNILEIKRNREEQLEKQKLEEQKRQREIEEQRQKEEAELIEKQRLEAERQKIEAEKTRLAQIAQEKAEREKAIKLKKEQERKETKRRQILEQKRKEQEAKLKAEQKKKIEVELKAKAKQRKIQIKIDAFVSDGDKEFNLQNWENAIAKYHEGLNLDPRNSYLIRQIRKCKKNRDRKPIIFLHSRGARVMATAGLIFFIVGVAGSSWYYKEYVLNRKPLLTGVYAVKNSIANNLKNIKNSFRSSTPSSTPKKDNEKDNANLSSLHEPTNYTTSTDNTSNTTSFRSSKISEPTKDQKDSNKNSDSNSSSNTYQKSNKLIEKSEDPTQVINPDDITITDVENNSEYGNNPSKKVTKKDSNANDKPYTGSKEDDVASIETEEIAKDAANQDITEALGQEEQLV